MQSAQQPLAEGQNTATQEDREDIRHISLWLDRGARKFHIGREQLWITVMLLNVAALIWLLYWVLFRGKAWSLPGAMRERSREIRERIDAAERAYQDAARRLSDTEARLASVEDEVRALHTQAADEAESEYRRLLDEARADAEKVARFNRQEIEAAVRAARMELRAFAADLALVFAESRLRQQLTPETDRQIVLDAAEELADGNRRR